MTALVWSLGAYFTGESALSSRQMHALMFFFLCDRNSQRPSAVTGMLVKEYENASYHREEGREYRIVRVKEHKTGSTERAKVTIHGDMLAIVEEWQKVRDATVPSSPLFFPNLKGGKVDHLYRHVSAVASRYGISLPQMQTVRSVVEVKAT